MNAYKHLLRTCSILLLSSALSQGLIASIRPSFWLDYSSWHATDIALVRIAQPDGHFEVVESWKGQLHPGERIVVPELSPALTAVSISFYPKDFGIFDTDYWPSLQIPRQPPGSQMVLFLTWGGVPGRQSAGTEPDPLRDWKPADRYGDFKTSVVWLDSGQVYAFAQMMNRGPSVLADLGISAPEVRDRVAEVSKIQLELDAVKMLDGDAKAMRLKPYLNLDLLPAREFALKELSQCGPSALATIRGMLDDAAFVNQRPEIIQAYVAAGGEAIAEDLNARLREQLTFWRATASSLSQGWWNDTPANDAIRNRYSDTLELLRVLQRMHYSEALYAATQLRDFWRSLPQLNDPSGLDQMIEECDKLIAHLQTN